MITFTKNSNPITKQAVALAVLQLFKLQAVKYWTINEYYVQSKSYGGSLLMHTHHHIVHADNCILKGLDEW